MALFGKSKEGGLLDVIRCDEEDYLIWKWSPSGDANSTKKENAIRYGSSLRVKDGEVAVFVYKQQNGPNQDFIEGPYDDTIKTANFPILSNIVGMAFGGASPFQAEVYFINLAGNQKRPFGIPPFNVADPREPDIVVPVGINGSFTYNITDYRAFIKLHRLISFNPEQFSDGVKDAVIKIAKGVVSKAPREAGIPLVRINEEIENVSDLIQEKLRTAFVEDFGVNLKRFDLANIFMDENSEGYRQLREMTSDLQRNMRIKQAKIAEQRLERAEEIESNHMEESLAIQREQAARFAKLQTESQFLGAHQVNVQGEVLKTAANNLGEMGTMNLGGAGGSSGGGSGFNPVGIMTGLAVGGAMGGQMANMMNATAQNMPVPGSAPPPIPQVAFNVLLNGQNSGPFGLQQIQQMIQQGQISPDTQVWKVGMVNWASAAATPELASLFASAPPPTPTAPPPVPQVSFNVLINGQSSGPFNLQQLQSMVLGGSLLSDSLVWTAGMPNWVPANTVSQLMGLFTQAAPPVPPSPPAPPPPPAPPVAI